MSTSDFEFLSRLGAGSFGQVHKVRRLLDGRIYVLKQVNISDMKPEDAVAATKECHIMAALNCTYVVKYFDSFIEEGQLNIVMEYCDGGDMQKLIQGSRDSGLDEQRVLRLFCQTLLGVEYLHGRRTLHRDLKTANVFLTSDEGVKVGDLGVARVLGTESFFARTLIGTPYYLAPELCRDEPYNSSSDMWALGVILYELTTGRHPFDARNQGALIMKIIAGKYEPVPPRISPEVRDLVTRLLCLDSRARPSAVQLLAEPLLYAIAKQNAYVLPASVEELIRVRSNAATDPARSPAAGQALLDDGDEPGGIDGEVGYGFPDAAALRLADRLLSNEAQEAHDGHMHGHALDTSRRPVFNEANRQGSTQQARAHTADVVEESRAIDAAVDGLNNPAACHYDAVAVVGQRSPSRVSRRNKWFELLSDRPEGQVHFIAQGTPSPSRPMSHARRQPAGVRVTSTSASPALHVSRPSTVVGKRERRRPARGQPAGPAVPAVQRRVLPLSEEAQKATAAAASRESASRGWIHPQRVPSAGPSGSPTHGSRGAAGPRISSAPTLSGAGGRSPVYAVRGLQAPVGVNASTGGQAGRTPSRGHSSNGRAPGSPPARNSTHASSSPALVQPVPPSDESRRHAAEVAALPDFPIVAPSSHTRMGTMHAPTAGQIWHTAPTMEVEPGADFEVEESNCACVDQDDFVTGENADEQMAYEDGVEEGEQQGEEGIEEDELISAREWISMPRGLGVSVRPGISLSDVDVDIIADLLSEREGLVEDARRLQGAAQGAAPAGYVAQIQAEEDLAGANTIEVDGISPQPSPLSYLALYRLEFALGRLEEISEELSRKGVIIVTCTY